MCVYIARIKIEVIIVIRVEYAAPNLGSQKLRTGIYTNSIDVTLKLQDAYLKSFFFLPFCSVIY